MANSIFESFHNKPNPFRTPSFTVQCQESSSGVTNAAVVDRRISAASVKGAYSTVIIRDV